jgi:hypothetical protein
MEDIEIGLILRIPLGLQKEKLSFKEVRKVVRKLFGKPRCMY